MSPSMESAQSIGTALQVAIGSMLALGACGQPVPEPEIHRVEPAHLVSGEEQRVSIQGANFFSKVQRRITEDDEFHVDDSFEIWATRHGSDPVERISLRNVSRKSHKKLNGDVPSTVEPGDYAIEVITPFGRNAHFAHAFDVSVDNTDVSGTETGRSAGNSAEEDDSAVPDTGEPSTDTGANTDANTDQETVDRPTDTDSPGAATGDQHGTDRRDSDTPAQDSESILWDSESPYTDINDSDSRMADSDMDTQGIGSDAGLDTDAPPNDRYIEARRANTDLTIDGALDETAWAPVTPIENILLGTPDNTALFDVLWDDSYLYIGVLIYDDILRNNSQEKYYDDSVDIVFDGNDNGTGWFDVGDDHCIKAYDDTSLYCQSNITFGIPHAVWELPGEGYSIELAVPWAHLGYYLPPEVGDTIGFDIGINDDDGLTSINGRDHQTRWNGTDDDWWDTTAFGTIKLSDEPAV